LEGRSFLKEPVLGGKKTKIVEFRPSLARKVTKLTKSMVLYKKSPKKDRPCLSLPGKSKKSGQAAKAAHFCGGPVEGHL
jgi:hypothetical protein